MLAITYNPSLKVGLRFIVSDRGAMPTAQGAARLRAIQAHLEADNEDIRPFSESEMVQIIRGSLLKASEQLGMAESEARDIPVSKGI